MADSETSGARGTEDEQRLRAAAETIRTLKNRVAELERRTAGVAPPAVAIVGLDCRFPGAEDGPAGFWSLLHAGRDAIRRVPADRWDADAWYDPDPATPGRTHSRYGGFLDDVAGFDAALFGLSPREAAALDPQQRLLLEVCWRALEHTGLPPLDLDGANVGVYAGISTADYAARGLWSGDPAQVDAHAYTGTAFNALAGRVAYLLGLRGPAMAVDTACSSSLVAVHLACQALVAGECDLALAGGVNAMIQPEMNVFFSKVGALTGDDRCKAFDADADGYLRGEGAGMVVLKRLDDARRDGDPVMAVIHGSAVNHDGRSNGFTAPNGPAQQAVIANALERAGVGAEALQMVEAHGSGTPLGDRIELQALGRVMAGREAPLLVGSVKTNVGHLEAAAGIAGLIKVVLALAHGVVPRSLHFSAPNPNVAWSELPLRVADEATAWPGPASARLAGVSSFGMSGTNAHVVVGAPPGGAADAAGETDAAGESGETPAGRPVVWPVSGLDAAALSAQAARHGAWLRAAADGGDARAARDGAFTAAAGRSALSARGVAVGPDAATLAAGLSALADAPEGPGMEAPAVADTVVAGARPGCVFLFPGQGAQVAGMGLALYEGEPTVRSVVDEVDAAVGGGVVAALSDGEALSDTRWTQPALFAVALGLSRLLRALGVAPAAFLGHSVGEYVAAVEAGMLGPGDGARLVSARARAMGALPAGGAMASAACDAERARAALEGYEDRAGLAAINGPRAVTLSGASEAIAAARARLEAEGIRVRFLDVSHAFHSPLMAPCEDDFGAALSGVAMAAPRLGVISNVDGGWHVAAPDAAYWLRHMRSPVQMDAGLRTLYEAGHRRFVEVGPGRGLAGLAGALGPDARGIALQPRPGGDERHDLARGLGALWCAGGSLDWTAWLGADGRKRRLPGYAFQRRRHWLEAPAPSATGGGVPLWRVTWPAAEGAAPAFSGGWTVYGEGPVASAVRAGLDDGGPGRLLVAADRTDMAGVRADLMTLAGWLEAGSGPVAVVTRGARRAAGGDVDAGGALQAALWGFGRSAALEHPDTWAGLIDLPAGDVAADAALLVGRALGRLDGAEREVAVRDGTCRVARLEALPAPPAAAAWPPVRSRGSYLVTGGSGALGWRLAEALASAGAGRVVAVGRRPVAAPPVGVDYRQAATPEALGDIVAELAPDLAGVAHVAGTGRFASAAATDADLVDEAFDAKVATALALEEALATHVEGAGRRLDWLVHYGSVAGVWGSAGQAVYGAANQVLEGLAEHRRARGLAGLCVAWGPWEGGGMSDGEALSQLEALGVEGLDPQAAGAVLNGLLAGGTSGTASPVAAVVDWSRFSAVYEARGRRALLDRVRPAAASDGGAPGDGDLAARLRSAPAGARAELALDAVRAVVASVLGLDDAAGVAPERGLFELGLDSLMAVEVARRLGGSLGTTVAPTVVFDGGTARGVAEQVLALLDLSGPAAEAAAPAAGAADDTVAIIGVACRFPGGGDTPEAFHAALLAGVDGVRPAPAAGRRGFTGDGGFLDLERGFDGELFGISPREAARLDPQHRLTLEVSREALERAGLAPDALGGRRAGVHVGISNADYGRLLEAAEGAEGLDLHHATGNALSAAAGRVAHVLGLRGPCLSVDTACSSSLVAIHLARRALLRGEAELMLAGGVNMLLAPAVDRAAWRAGMLSASGRCRTFDAGADGYVRGEGCGMVVLKRLSEARRDGDRVLGVIAGSAMNHNGAGAGLTVPSGSAQAELLGSALAEAGVSGPAVEVLEAHGTGTSLGDPIELGAAGAVFRPADAPKAAPLAVGSVKTNIGHLESAAGVAGLIKVVQALGDGRLPGHLHLDTPNPRIDWRDGRLAVPDGPWPWARGAGRRIAGVSSFGFTGTNAHLVVTDPPAAEDAPREAAPSEGPWPVLLAARGADALAAQAARVAAWVAARPAAEPGPVARELAAGRAALPARAAFVAATRADLLAGLRAAAGEPETAAPAVHGSPADGPAEGTVWLFTGQGAAAAGMGRALYGSAPAFTATVDRCAAALSALGAPWTRPLPEVLFAGTDEGAAALEAAAWAQPALYALQCGLAAELWAWGPAPSAVAGHSLGEYAAAWVAGVYGLEDGLRLVAERGRLMDTLAPSGGMLAVEADAETTRPYLADGAEVAVINGPDAVTVAGPAAALAATADALAEAGVRSRRLAVTHAFHSAAMAPVAEAFASAASATPLAAPGLTLVRGEDGAVQAAAPTAAGWADGVRQPVRFDRVLARLGAEHAHRAWVEVGPRPILLGLAGRAAAAQGGPAPRAGIATLRPALDARAALADTAAALYAAGPKPDPRALFRNTPPLDEPLPTYPFQRQYAWVAGLPIDAPDDAATGADMPLIHGVTWQDAGPAAEGPRFPDPADLPLDTADILAGTETWNAFLDRVDAACRAALAGVPVPSDAVPDALRRLAGRLAAVAPEGEAPPADSLNALAREEPAFAGEIALLERALESLPDVLAGRAEGVDVLFADDSLSGLYREAPLADRLNALAGRSLAGLLADWPAERRLRVLEIGGGTAGTTAHLLDALPGAPADYVFTDVSPAFLPAAPDHPAVRGAVLDIARPPEEQGFQPGTFDVVVAANVIHATPDLRRALDHAARLLAPGGALVLLEVVVRRLRFDLVFGQTPGWWAFADTDLRPDHALVPAATWRTLLADAGFDAVRTVSDPEAGGLPDQALFLARKAAASAAGTPPARADGDRVVMAAPDPRAPLAEAALAAVRPVLDALAEPDPGRLWLVTHGAMAVTPDDAPSPAGAAAWGLGRVLAREHPETLGGLVDLDPARPVEAQRQALDAWMARGDADEAALRGDRWLTPRLAAEVPPPDGRLALAGGTWIVTGGLGGLGPLVAGRLAERGAHRIVLVSRRGEPAPDQGEALAAVDAEVLVRAGDCADADAMAALFAEAGPVTGIVHAAGVLDDGVLATQTPERFARVLHAKVAGAAVLDRLSRDHPVAHFVLFSSATATLGPPGQANHAAANAVLDSLAARRRAEGLPGMALHWGGWARVGAAADLAATRGAPAGTRALEPAEALDAMEAAMTGTAVAPLLLPADWSAYVAGNPGDRGRALFRATAAPQHEPSAQPAEAEAPAAPEAPGTDLATRLAGLPAPRRRPETVKAVRAEAATIFGYADPERLPVGEPLVDLGLDSLMALNLRNRLSALCGTELPAHLLFDHPTVEAIADHLLGTVLAPSDTAGATRAGASGAPATPDAADLDFDTLASMDEESVAALLETYGRDEQGDSS